MQMGQHTVHGDVQARGIGRSGLWHIVTIHRTGDRVLLMLNQRCPERFGGVTHTIWTDVDQGEAVEHACGFDEGILGRAEEGEEFVEASTAAASTQLELSIQRMLTMSTGTTEIIGRYASWVS